MGFDASLGTENTADAIMGVKYVYALLPASIFLVATAVVWNYPLDRAAQQRVRAAIDRRGAGVGNAQSVSQSAD